MCIAGLRKCNPYIYLRIIYHTIRSEWCATAKSSQCVSPSPSPVGPWRGVLPTVNQSQRNNELRQPEWPQTYTYVRCSHMFSSPSRTSKFQPKHLLQTRSTHQSSLIQQIWIQGLRLEPTAAAWPALAAAEGVHGIYT